MELRFGILRRKAKTKAAGFVTTSPELVQVLNLLDGTSASYGTLYRKILQVRTVVDFIADAVADTPLKVYRRAEHGRPEVRDHPVAQLLANPNPYLTPQRFIFGTIADLAVYGHAYWRKVISGGTRSLVPLPPYRVTPRGGDLLTPSSFDFYPVNGTAPNNFGRDEIVYMHLYDPEDRRVGASKLESLKSILTEEIEASRYRRRFWKNHAQIEGVLKYPGQLSDDAAKRLRVDFDNRYAGEQNAGRTAILEEGLDWQATTFSSKEAEFMAGREFVLKATAHVFNLPLSLLSLTDTATYASQREFRKQLYTEVLPPWFELIQSEIELQLFPWFTNTADLYVEFLVESKLRGDFMDQAALVYQSTGRPYMTVAEARDLFNMEDRRVSSDEELVVPVGPNFALESQPPPAPLAAVASLESERLRRAVVEFFEHQERSVMARMGAGGAFEHARWNRALAPILGDVHLAERVNLQTAIELQAAEDPRAVFEEAKRIRLPLILREVQEAV